VTPTGIPTPGATPTGRPEDPRRICRPTAGERTRTTSSAAISTTWASLWEAHEAWEGLWHSAKHDALQAEHLQGLIQCAAASLKVRMGQPRGLERLAQMGTERLERVAGRGASYMGLDVRAFVRAFRAFASSAPEDAEGRPRLELQVAFSG
jgi:hypothetical protein